MNTQFGKDEHRQFNRNGAAFDKGETFSGIDYETGLKAVGPSLLISYLKTTNFC